MLILASNSPRRQRLLGLLGLNYQVLPAEVDESVISDEKPQDYVLRLARIKSLSVTPLPPSVLVIAADTAVVDGEKILGKPATSLQAREMLQTLRGREHQVYTGIAVRDISSGAIHSDLCFTNVLMRPYQETEIDDYVSSGDPLDKAGAYAIQHRDFNPVQKITGCYANVVGLPLCHLTDLLRRLELKIPKDITQGCRTPQGYSCQLSTKIQDISV
jgi:MAF protein